MRLSLALLLASTLVLTACQSRYNPMNWFGGSEEIAVDGESEVNPLIPQSDTLSLRRPEVGYPGVLIARIDDLDVERIPGGAIIHVEATAAVQGVHELKLSPHNNGIPENGVLSYDLLGIHPSGGATGSENSRELNVAHVLTDQQLTGVRTIRVNGATNARQSRR